jgi:hypothetical protein
MGDPAEDANGDGVWDAADCAGVTTGTLRGVVVDADSGALIEGARIAFAPLGQTLTTGADGRFSLASAPFGVYAITATAPSLALSGNAVVPALDVSTTVTGVSLLAGQQVALRLALGRIDRATVNLTQIHLPGAVFTPANCIACHTNRQGETSTNPAIPTYHNVTTHRTLPCTACHTGVDVENESGWAEESFATLRKQVDTATRCRGCHQCYPRSFCSGANCPTPCP